MTDAFFVRTEPASSIVNPAHIHITSAPHKRNAKVLNVNAISLSTAPYTVRPDASKTQANKTLSRFMNDSPFTNVQKRRVSTTAYLTLDLVSIKQANLGVIVQMSTATFNTTCTCNVACHRFGMFSRCRQKYTQADDGPSRSRRWNRRCIGLLLRETNGCELHFDRERRNCVSCVWISPSVGLHPRVVATNTVRHATIRFREFQRAPKDFMSTLTLSALSGSTYRLRSSVSLSVERIRCQFAQDTNIIRSVVPRNGLDGRDRTGARFSNFARNTTVA